MTFVESESDQAARQEHEAGGLAVSLSGCHMPLVEIELDAGQGIVCALGAVIQRDEIIGIRPWPGLADSISMRLLVNQSEEDRANVTLGTGYANKAGVFDLDHHGGRLLCPQQALLVAGPGVMTSVYSRYRNLDAGELDVMLLEGDGHAVLRACGQVKHLKLNPGQQAIVNAWAIAAMSATVDLDPLEEDDNKDCVALTGPGQVWLQSGSPVL